MENTKILEHGEQHKLETGSTEQENRNSRNMRNKSWNMENRKREQKQAGLSMATREISFSLGFPMNLHFEL